MKKIILTRTVPLDDFIKILKFLIQEKPDYEIVLLIQYGLAEKQDLLKGMRKIELFEGPFALRYMSRDTLDAIDEFSPEFFVIASNNPQFSGYDEWIKVAASVSCEKILMITKDLKTKSVSRQAIRGSQNLQQVKTFFHLIFVSILFVLLYPFSKLRKQTLK